MFFLRRDGGMRAGVDGVLLGGKAERVPAHRMEHVEPAHPLEAAIDVGRGVAFGMADVQARAAGVGEHVEHVELLLGRVFARGERLVFGPVALPLRLDLVERIFLAEFRHKARRLYRRENSYASVAKSGECPNSKSGTLDYPGISP